MSFGTVIYSGIEKELRSNLKLDMKKETKEEEIGNSTKRFGAMTIVIDRETLFTLCNLPWMKKYVTKLKS